MVLWESGPQPGIADEAWTLQTFDISPLRSEWFQLRIGYELGDGAFACGGWERGRPAADQRQLPRALAVNSSHVRSRCTRSAGDEGGRGGGESTKL